MCSYANIAACYCTALEDALWHFDDSGLVGEVFKAFLKWFLQDFS